MNTYLNYLIEANLCLLLFFGAYVLLLNKETNFTFKRVYLFFSILASLFFPLFTIGLGNSSIPKLGNAIPVYMLPEIVIGNGPKVEVIETNYFSIWMFVFIIYIIGILVFLSITLYQLFRLYQCLKGVRIISETRKYKIYETDQAIPTFSFFKWIIIGEAGQLKAEEKQQIIRHEIEHIRNYHSIDILLAEIVRILFWFNPFVYPLRKMLSDIHEYQADEKTVREIDIQDYCSLLARITLQSAGFTLANHFNKSLTVKRINMMKSMKKKMKKWKIGAVAAIAAGLFFTISCQDQVTSEINEIAQESSMALDMPSHVQLKLAELKANNPDGKFFVTEISGDDEKVKIEELAKQNGGNESVKTMEIFKEKIDGEDERTFVIMELGESNGDVVEWTKQDGEVFVVVEEMAQPVGGMEELYKHMMQNMQYPIDAKINNITGKVFIEFIVEKDGSISDAHVKKGIGYGCDEEALRVLKSFNNWSPAQQDGENVRQQLILPISFNMGNGEMKNNIVIENDATFVKKEIRVRAMANSLDDDKVKVEGTISDGDGNPISGANIMVQGTTEGTVSDAEGNFSIVKEKDQKLNISHVNYTSKTVVLE